MMTSLDGKIMGKYMETPEGEIAGTVFYNIAFGKDRHYKHQGWLSGRVTTDDNFTFYEKPALNEPAPLVPEGDFVAKQAGMYYVSVDPSGKLGWKDSTLTYIDTTAHVIEVLTGRASNAYKDFLRRQAGLWPGNEEAERTVRRRNADAGRWRCAELVLPPSRDVR